MPPIQFSTDWPNFTFATCGRCDQRMQAVPVGYDTTIPFNGAYLVVGASSQMVADGQGGYTATCANSTCGVTFEWPKAITVPGGLDWINGNIGEGK